MAIFTTGSAYGTVGRENVAAAPINLVYNSAPLFTLLMAEGRMPPSTGESPAQWNVVTAAPTATEWTESEVFSTPNSSTYKRAVSNAFWYKSKGGFSHFQAVNNSKPNGTYGDLAAAEDTIHAQQVVKALNGVLLGSVQDRGLLSIVDDADTAFGLDPATYPNHKSAVVDAESGPLTAALMNEALELAERNAVNGGGPTHIVMSPQNARVYRDLGLGGTSVSPLVLTNGEVYDLGLNRTMAFCGLPIITDSDLADTDVLFLDLRDVEIQLHEPLTTIPLPSLNANQEFVVACGIIPVVKTRRNHVKISNIVNS